MQRDLVVIGAGTAGLSAAVYAAASGYRVTVLEAGRVPGGLCASWRRGGYLFDGSAAGLAGTGPGSKLETLWRDLGVLDGLALYDAESFGRVVCSDGRVITVYTDIDRLEAHLLENFPADAGAIRDLAGALRGCLSVDVPFTAADGWAGLVERLRDGAASLRNLPVLLRWGTTTLRDFARRLRDPAFAEVFHNLVHFGGPDVPLLTVLLPLAFGHRRLAGIPRDGWLAFGLALARRVEALGGVVRCGARVRRLVVEGGAARGVELEGGELVRAQRVLSAADGRFTRTVLLGEREDPRRFDPARLSDQPVQVNLGVAEDWSDERGPLTFLLPDAPRAAGRAQARLTVHSRSHDPSSAPPGHAALTAFLESDWEFWRGLDRERYEAEKRACADLVVAALERRRPGFAARVRVVDVATPLTRERFTGNWRGAMQARRPDASMVRALLAGAPRYDHPRVRGFWMAGQWVEAWGGITTAAISGRKAIQAMCRRDRVRFAAPAAAASAEPERRAA